MHGHIERDALALFNQMRCQLRLRQLPVIMKMTLWDEKVKFLKTLIEKPGDNIIMNKPPLYRWLSPEKK
jgi:signal peptidase I